MRSLILCTLSLLGAACALDAEPAPDTRHQALAAPTSPALPTPPVEVADAAKTPDPVARFGRAELDWAAAAQHTKLDPTWLSAAQQAKIDAAPVPLLLPADEALVRAAHISAGARWGAWHVQQGDITVRMHATDALVEVPQLEIKQAGEALAKQPYTLTRTHQIITVTFNRFGAGYALDIECARPTEDTRCTEDAFAAGLMERLAVAPRGGAR